MTASIRSIGSAKAAIAYYITLAAEVAYYLLDAVSTWWGRGARELGLEGKAVDRQALHNLLRGLRPDGAASLVQLGRGHAPGYDVAFSAPKSVSILWALAPRKLREAIAAAHEAACKAALRLLEDFVKTRRGKGGRILEAAGLVVALVHHATSRALDPALHTHCLILNLALRSDGSYGTLRGRDLYRLKMAAGALYRAALARELRARGLRLVPGKNSFEVAGIPQGLIREFSTRRRQIEADLAERGESGAKAAEAAALRTRPRKRQADPAELQRDWLARAKEHGVTPELISSLVLERPKRPVEVPLGDIRKTIRGAADRLANERSGFTEHELVRAVAAKLEHRGPAPQALVQAVKAFLGDPLQVEEVPPLRRDEPRFAPAWLAEKERSLLALVKASVGSRSSTRKRAVLRVLARHGLSPEQEAALRYVTLEDGLISCVVGVAGSGKTTLMRAVRESFERSGRRVIGAALSAQAARKLEKGSGIESRTVARLLRDLERKPLQLLGHHARQLLRAARKKRTWRLKRETLGRTDVLVVDEAALVGTVQLEALVRHATRAGAKLVLVGDHRQLQSIEAGGGFAAVVREFGAARLEIVRRQQREWMRQAVLELTEGDVDCALSLYASHGRVSVARDKAGAIAELIRDWARERTPELADTLILGTTREEVRHLNLAAQAERRRAGALGPAITVGSGALHEGDRVVFTSNHRGLGVMNGDRGTLERVHALVPNRFARMTFRLDREDEKGQPVRVTFTPSSFDAVELGYAATAHKAQGVTVSKSFVLGGGWMQSRELALVQLSRHTDDARLYVSEYDAGEDLAALSLTMSRSRRKELAIAPPEQLQEVEREL